MDDITSKPYAAWLEQSLKAMMEIKPVSMCIVATGDNGDTLTGYFNADAQDKAVFAHHIQSDVMMDIIRANAAEIKSVLDEEE